MSQSPTPSVSFLGNNLDGMMEFNIVKELVLNSGAVFYHNFVDQKLVFKVLVPEDGRATNYEAVLMGRYRNDRVIVDCFTVLERSNGVYINRHTALEELLDVLEHKLLSLPRF